VTAPMSVAEREHLAQQYASRLAPWLRFAVHQGDADLIEDLIGGLDRQQLLALAVVLAADGEAASRPDDGLVDEVAIQRVTGGEFVPLSPREQVVAAKLLKRRGRTWDEMTALLRVSRDRLARLLAMPEQPSLFDSERRAS
jgi:hypothetical protein